MEQLARWLGGTVDVRVLPVARDTPDHTFAAFWAHPERALEPEARAATSGWARLDPQVAAAAIARLRADLASGAWDARHGRLRGLDAYDAGLRLVVAAP